MTYRGHVENGAVVLDAPTALPEGATVEVAVAPEPVSPPETEPFHEWIEAQAASVSKAALAQMPEDASINHDHYLYGARKREP